jgi:hypothetical protein
MLKEFIKAFITDRLTGWLLNEWYDCPEAAIVFAQEQMKKLKQTNNK